jgi:hypothetical protein
VRFEQIVLYLDAATTWRWLTRMTKTRKTWFRGLLARLSFGGFYGGDSRDGCSRLSNTVTPGCATIAHRLTIHSTEHHDVECEADPEARCCCRPISSAPAALEAPWRSARVIVLRELEGLSYRRLAQCRYPLGRSRPGPCAQALQHDLAKRWNGRDNVNCHETQRWPQGIWMELDLVNAVRSKTT